MKELDRLQCSVAVLKKKLKVSGMQGTQFCEGEEIIPLCPVTGALSKSAAPFPAPRREIHSHHFHESI